MKKYTHESAECNALLGKLVEVTFYDGEKHVGILRRDDWKGDKYRVNMWVFRKSLIKKIVEVKI